MKREIPLIIAFISGVFMIIDLFIPHPFVAVPAQTVRDWSIIITAFAYVLGVANIAKINGEVISRRSKDWQYKVLLIVSLVAMTLIGILFGINPGTTFDWLYMNMYVPMQSTMFALLAFFIASAAFRAFRIRTIEATLLLVTALIVMLGRVPLGSYIWKDMPDFTEWIMNVPNLAAKRGILIGAALGAISTGLKTILGLERSYLGGD